MMSNSLFKYCEINEYTIKNLRNNQLYFNAPKNYNDPYEGIFGIKIKDIDLKYKFLQFIYQHKYEELISSKLSIDDLLEHTRIEYVNQFLKDMRICCMSYINNSMLMWTHYAKQHEGICIEFDSSDDIFLIGSSVNYSEKVPVLNINSIDDISISKIMEIYGKIVATKHIDWNYEKEYRIFRYLGSSRINYKPSSIKAIYFGLRCSRENETIIRAVTTNNKSVQYYKADLERDSYRFRFINC